jgi:diguanylate cyclase (GGDEF)-like protein
MTPINLTVNTWARALRGLCAACMALLMLGMPVIARADDVTAQILALEDSGRAHPLEAAQALEQLRASTAEFSAQRLELLTVQGLTLAMAWHPEPAEHAAAELEAWGQLPGLANAPSAAAAALLIRARQVAPAGNLPRADAMVRDALARLPHTTLARDRWRFVWALGFFRDESGKLEDAVRLNHEALALADQQPDTWRQAEARIQLAYSYFSAHQLERARALGREAQALAERSGDWVSLGRAQNLAAVVLDGLGDPLGQRRGFEQAIDSARRAGSKIDETRYLANLADFYLKNSDYKTALSLAERALPMARELKDPSAQMVALANVGLAHISLQHLELGKRYVHKAIAIDERRGSATGAAESWRELGVYLEKAGDLPAAAVAYHRHRRLAAELLRDGQQQAILAMQEQYDADRRTRSIDLLNRENAIKAEQLHRRDLEQRLWGLLAAAFVLSFAVVALLYRRIRRNNRLLATSNEMLAVQSERDPLTGLANRRHLRSAMRRLAADGKLSGTVYRIDIDHFKQINDRCGHGGGDAVLVEVARRLRETLREEDLIVRWGGEEFLVIVGALAAEQVDALAQRMLAALDHAPVHVEAHRVALTGSIGFATFPIGPALLRVSWERAIDLADTAMYLAKAHGRNRAYGVRVLHARDEAALVEITRSLDVASRDGRIELNLLQGRTPLAVAVAA